MMKIWKTVGCLVLLCVIIGGCVVIGTEAQDTEVNDPSGAPSEQEEQLEGENELNAAPNEEETGGSVVIAPTYSEGLAFRSNGDGTCALAGVGSCTSSCILIPPTSPAGDTVTEILPYALQGSIIGAIEIPTTVKTLSAASFAGCPRLSYLRVATGNEWYSEYDGVLYSADGSTLVYCPAGRSAAELKLHTSLRRIAAAAFGECTALKTIVFQGTTAAWHGVIVGDGNEALYAASFRFGS